jgi:transcriptional regulator with XRE-family HTH domain
MRPSKNLHLLCRLRRELNLSQADVGAKVGVTERTIRRIELGSQKLTAALAERIGDSYDVAPSCLAENNLGTGLRTRNGRRWTAKTRLEIRSRLQRWGELEPYARHVQRDISAVLLHQYLRMANLIRKMPEPERQLYRWTQLFYVAWGALVNSEPAMSGLTWGDVEPDPSLGGLDQVFDDLQAVRSDRQLIQRIEKNQPKKQDDLDWKQAFKLYMIVRLGWTDRGKIGLDVIDELTNLDPEKAENMKIEEWDDLIYERCKKLSARLEEPFDPFGAIESYRERHKQNSRPAKK